MNSSTRFGLFLVAMAVAGVVIGAGFTDLDTLQHQGKTGLKDLVTGIDANFAMLEDGSVNLGKAVYVSSDNKVTNTVATNGTVTLMGAAAFKAGVSTTNDVNIDAKYAMVGPDAANGLEVQYGTVTNGQAAVAFGHVFGAGLEPKVFLQCTDVTVAPVAGTNFAATPTLINTTNFTLAVSACPVTLNLMTNFTFMAIGRRP